jgi:hypothetical protein
MAGLTASTRAECWRTPLSVEDALNALLPETIQERIIEHVARDWQARESELEAVWRPILTQLASAYIDLIAEDFRRALDVREDVLVQTATDAAAKARTHWPEVQRRLNPIIQEHLTPVLSRLMDDALDQAPKARIAWYLYRNNSREAFNLLLEWQTRFMVELPEKDRQEVAQAFRDTWRAAAEDQELVERVKALGRELRDDPQIIQLLEDIYRETISDNPKTAEFLRQAILKSPQIQQEFYQLIEWFAPTARQVTALCLFDENGATRPEIVHLLRSIALRRQMAWVTLVTPGAGPELAPGATLPAEIRGGT